MILDNVLSEQELWEEASSAAQEAMEILRRLTPADPDAYESALALAFNDLAVDLSATGRGEEALAATAEAVKIRRRLARVNPAAHEYDLAGSLSNLGKFLSGWAGRQRPRPPPERQ